jgi:PIN domain nuclease of toxin-antitoxin system
MIGPLLLDTCAALWLTTEEIGLKPVARDVLAQADEAGQPIYLSPITAWEVGQLVARGRYALSMPPQQWFETLLESGLVLAPMTPEILVGASFLPVSQGLRDPADRIMASTARSQGFTLITRDKPLLGYAAGGHIRAVPC